MKNRHSLSLPSRVLNSRSVGKSTMYSTLKNQMAPKVCAVLLAACSSNLLYAASCDYAIVDEWEAGFKAEISIMNDSDTPITDWDLSWNWTDGSSFANGWQASFDCSGSACTAGPTNWSNGIAANQTHVLGFLANKGVNGEAADTSITINGDICGTLVAPTPTPVPTPVPTPEPTPEPTPTPTPIPDSLSVLWTLDGAQSNVQYVTVKNDNTAEVNSFVADAGEEDALNGTIDRFGNAILSIDLNDVHTNIDIRDERMAEFVFETELLPTAYITVDLDTSELTAMPVGSSVESSLLTSVNLHGVNQVVLANVLIVKRSASDITVTTLEPINVDSKSFDLASGVEVLRTIASLSSIGEVVPVYFSLQYVANTDESIQPLAMPEAPAAPSLLVSAYDSVLALATLNWQDNSDNEEAFIVRRKTSLGLWQTVTNVFDSISNYSEGLPDTGEFDYKVIAVNGSVASEASNISTVAVTEVDTLALGKELYDAQCAACHAADGSGVGFFPAINTPTDIDPLINYITDNMPIPDVGTCDAQCAEYVTEYIETFWVESAE